MESFCQGAWILVILTHIAKLLFLEVVEMYTSISSEPKASNFQIFSKLTWPMVSHFCYDLLFYHEQYTEMHIANTFKLFMMAEHVRSVFVRASPKAQRSSWHSCSDTKSRCFLESRYVSFLAAPVTSLLTYSGIQNLNVLNIGWWNQGLNLFP